MDNETVNLNQQTNIPSLTLAWFFTMFQYFVLFVVFMHQEIAAWLSPITHGVYFGVYFDTHGVYFGKGVKIIAGMGHRLRGDRDIKGKGNCTSSREKNRNEHD